MFHLLFYFILASTMIRIILLLCSLFILAFCYFPTWNNSIISFTFYFLRNVVYKRKYCVSEKINLHILTDLHVFSPLITKNTILLYRLAVRIDVRLASAWMVGQISIISGTQDCIQPTSVSGESEYSNSKIRASSYKTILKSLSIFQ
jgi:hypothetical protein